MSIITTMFAPLELRRIHPLGTAQVIAETGAIIEYLVGSLMPVLFVKLVLGRVPLLGRIAQKKFQPMIDVRLDYIESELAGRPWFAGESFTAVDVMMSFPLEAARSRAGISRDTHPHIFKWLDTIHARAACQVALAKGGPYAYA